MEPKVHKLLDKMQGFLICMALLALALDNKPLANLVCMVI